MREEEHQKDDVHHGKGGDGKREAAGTLLEGRAFQEADDAGAKQAVLAQKEPYQIVLVIHDFTSAVGLPNARVETAHDGRNVSDLVPDHRFGNVRDGDEHR